MEISSDKIWNPKEWEQYANDLLRERYRSISGYIPIPDLHGGDGGIEGFSLDGNVYQMYCPQNALTTEKLYDDQRDKMTADITKFITNKSKMTSFFGKTKIKRWILVVPQHQTSKIVSHATKKTQEVLDANLSYVDSSDFRVLVWDKSEFRKEELSLLSSGIAVLKLSHIKVSEVDVNDYSSGEPVEFIDNLDRKLSKLNSTPDRLRRGKGALIKSAIISQNILSELKQDYAEIYEQVTSTQATRASQLDLEIVDADPETQSLRYQTDTLSHQLNSKCNLHEDNLTEISRGTVSDWLMNCTLDFD